MDAEKEEMNQADIAALHHFYSRHISDLPDDQALTELFAQVHNKITPQTTFLHRIHTVFRLLWRTCSNSDDGSDVTTFLILLSFLPLAPFFLLCLQVNCNGFTIEDEELSHLGSAVFPE